MKYISVNNILFSADIIHASLPYDNVDL